MNCRYTVYKLQSFAKGNVCLFHTDSFQVINIATVTHQTKSMTIVCCGFNLVSGPFVLKIYAFSNPQLHGIDTGETETSVY